MNVAELLRIHHWEREIHKIAVNPIYIRIYLYKNRELPTKLLAFSFQSVSVQTAHKWLRGRAIPKADKIETLTQWLNVSAHWLRYGSPPVISKENDKLKQTSFPPTAETLVLAQKVEALPKHQRYLIDELVKQLSCFIAYYESYKNR